MRAEAVGSEGPNLPRVLAVGIGPAGADLVPDTAKSAISRAKRVFLRTAIHPSAPYVAQISRCACCRIRRHLRDASTFAEVYDRIVETVVASALEEQTRNSGRDREDGGEVVYLVPGSPLVAERTVELLRTDDRVELVIVPAMSFLDLAWARLGVDPVSSSVRLVDGTDFAAQAAGERGPLLVGADPQPRDPVSGEARRRGSSAPARGCGPAPPPRTR